MLRERPRIPLLQMRGQGRKQGRVHLCFQQPVRFKLRDCLSEAGTGKQTSRTIVQPTPPVQSSTFSLTSSIDRTTNSPVPSPAWTIVVYTAFIFSRRASTGSIATIRNGSWRIARASSILMAAQTPTGPKPIIATVNTLSSAFKPTSFPGSSRGGEKHSGHGRPVITGATLGWLIACSAAKTPVGRMSASMSRELSVSSIKAFSFSSLDMLLDHVEGSLRLNRVPPAFGTRTYCA